MEVGRAGAAPFPSKVAQELRNDIGNDLSKQKALQSNWKMKLGIALGVLVGIAVIAIVAGGVVASHGAIGAALGIIATKLTVGSQLAAHAIHGGGLVAKAISAIATALVFLGGGKIAGKLFNKGESEALENLAPTSSAEIKKLEETFGPVTDAEIQNHRSKSEGTVLSVQAGRNFVQAGRNAKLHYAGDSYKGFFGIIKKFGKGFGHFWGLVATTTLKSFSDRKQYGMYNENLRLEKNLKQLSANGDNNALKKLNQLRTTQIEQYVGKLDVVGVAYAKAPELLAFDRNIAKLEILKTRAESSGKATDSIDAQILMERAKKSELLKGRLGPGELGSIITPAGPLVSLLTVAEDVKGLNGVTDEAKGQILEAVSILLRQNSEATIQDVNHLFIFLRDKAGELGTSTRESVIKYADQFAAAKREGADVPELRLESSTNTAPISAKHAAHLLLKTLDIGISAIHALPISGSSALAGAVTAYAVTKEKGSSFASVVAKTAGSAKAAFAEIRRGPAALRRTK